MYTLRIEYCLESWTRPVGYDGMTDVEAVNEAAQYLERSTFARLASKAALFNDAGECVKQWIIGTAVR